MIRCFWQISLLCLLAARYGRRQLIAAHGFILRNNQCILASEITICHGKVSATEMHSLLFADHCFGSSREYYRGPLFDFAGFLMMPALPSSAGIYCFAEMGALLRQHS